MRSADRMLTYGTRVPDDWKGSEPHIWPELRGRPILVADNVATYVRERPFVMDELPCVAPPWPEAFIEYPNHTGHERRAILMTDVTSWREMAARTDVETTRAEAILAALENASSYGFDVAETKWILQFAVFIDGLRNEPLIGPVAIFILVLDQVGRIVGNRWVLGTLRQDPTYVRRMQEGENEWLLSVVAPALQAIAFLHCKNVRTEEHGPPPKLSKRYAKRHGHPMVRWQEVRLEVPRRQGAHSGHGHGETPGLHIVAGHFSHYGDCCPGVHEPKGKLFGRLSGVYWMPSHVRGDPRRGVIITDRDLMVP